LLSSKSVKTRHPIPQQAGRRKTTVTPYGIVISPTRELASQMYKILRGLSHNAGVETILLTGGTLTTLQRQKLLNNSHPQHCTIIVRTPSRVVQYVNERTTLSLDRVHNVVVDEAD